MSGIISTTAKNAEKDFDYKLNLGVIQSNITNKTNWWLTLWKRTNEEMSLKEHTSLNFIVRKHTREERELRRRLND